MLNLFWIPAVLRASHNPRLHSTRNQACCYGMKGGLQSRWSTTFARKPILSRSPTPGPPFLDCWKDEHTACEGLRVLMVFRSMFCICRHFDWSPPSIFKGQIPGFWPKIRNLPSDLQGYAFGHAPFRFNSEIFGFKQIIVFPTNEDDLKQQPPRESSAWSRPCQHVEIIDYLRCHTNYNFCLQIIKSYQKYFIANTKM